MSAAPRCQRCGATQEAHGRSTGTCAWFTPAAPVPDAPTRERVTAADIVRLAVEYDHSERGGVGRGEIDEELAVAIADFVNARFRATPAVPPDAGRRESMARIELAKSKQGGRVIVDDLIKAITQISGTRVHLPDVANLHNVMEGLFDRAFVAGRSATLTPESPDGN